MAIEIVEIPIKNGGSFQFVILARLPEGFGKLVVLLTMNTDVAVDVEWNCNVMCKPQKDVQLWPWLLVITGYFYGVIHFINGVFLVLITGISGHNCSIWNPRDLIGHEFGHRGHPSKNVGTYISSMVEVVFLPCFFQVSFVSIFFGGCNKSLIFPLPVR